MTDADVLTKDQVADLLQCDATTVEEHARNGDLPGVKYGRSWVFPRAALLARLNDVAQANPNRARTRRESMHERVQAEIARNRKAAGIPIAAVKRTFQPGG